VVLCLLAPSLTLKLFALWILFIGALRINLWRIRRHITVFDDPSLSNRFCGWIAMGLIGLVLLLPSLYDRFGTAPSRGVEAHAESPSDSLESRQEAAQGHLEAAIEYYDAGDVGLALVALQQAVSIYPQHATAAQLRREWAAEATAIVQDNQATAKELQTATRNAEAAARKVDADATATAVVAARRLPVGALFETNEWAYTVTRVEEATSVLHPDGAIRAQGKYVIVFMTVANRQRTQDSLKRREAFKLTDQLGNSYTVADSAPGRLVDPSRRAADNNGQRPYFDAILPGLAFNTVLVFDVNPAATSYTLSPWNGGDRVIVLS
jgi:hypothetical protein